MVTFVILHYNDYEITEQAIDAIMRGNARKAFRIVVVDNGSPNGSGKLLEEKYKNEDSVKVLLTGRNLGFAKGNNVGYAYAKNHYDPEYIVVMNNDVIIEQPDFVSVLENNEQLRKYEIIMPDIINKNGHHQNPFREKPMSDEELGKNYRKVYFFKVFYNIPVISTIWMKCKKRQVQSIPEKKQHFYNKSMMVPHGACVIYSKRWIDKEGYAFIPNTFLYGEEDILYEYITNKKYRTYYEEGLIVMHLEDVATKSIAQTDLKRARFLFKNSFDSQQVLKQIREYNRNHRDYTIEGD